MSTTSPTVHGMSTEPLTSLGGKEPDNVSFTDHRNTIMALLAKVPTLRGTGQHGHIILAMAAADYQALSATPAAGGNPAFAGHVYDIPAHPGIALIVVPGETQTALKARERLHDAAIADWHKHTAVETACKDLWFNAYGDLFLSDLKDPILMYANVSLLAMITHICVNWATKNPDC